MTQTETTAKLRAAQEREKRAQAIHDRLGCTYAHARVLLQEGTA